MHSLQAWFQQFLRYQEGREFTFTQFDFWIFFGLFLCGYSLVYARRRARHLLILVFSLFFYYKASGWAVLLLLYTITQDFLLAGALARSQSPRRRIFIVSLSICTSLLVLAYFKYAFLLTGLLNDLFGLGIPKVNWLATLLPDNDLLQIDRDSILLPVGISFFIFHSLSYIIDVYRGLVTPLRSWTEYAVFVSFFPELVAGPIVRARDFLDQLHRPYSLSRPDFGKGVFLVLTGLIKKIILSDYVATNLVDKVFDNPQLSHPAEAWLAVYGYALQIFCDFSGYTDIAIGLALLLGYQLRPNFDQPYKATDITDFWRRWHISLSVWLRDYLYIPLGGNRKGIFRTYLNLLITMFLGGLWHGASLRFVVWGTLHGVALAVHKGWMQLVPSFRLPGWISGLLTFHFVALCWIPFRASDWENCRQLWLRLWSEGRGAAIPEMMSGYAPVLALMGAGYFLHLVPTGWKEGLSNWFSGLPPVVQGLLALAGILLLYQFRTAGSRPFIYFQF